MSFTSQVNTFLTGASKVVSDDSSLKKATTSYAAASVPVPWDL